MHDLRELQARRARPAPTTSTAPRTTLQKLTDEKVDELDALLKGKEEEILEV